MTDSIFNEALLIRQPILDLKQELVGYELMLRPSRESAAADARNLSAMLVCAAYAELGIRCALGRRAAFLRVDTRFLHDDAIEALPADSVVLELVLDGTPDARTLERCRTLRDRRYVLALTDYSGLDERSRSVLTLLDIIKIDIRQHDLATLNELAAPLARLPLKLLAQGVETREEMEHCQQIGFQLFQGDYYARTEIVSGRRLSASQASLIQLINLSGRDADTRRIEEGIKREPALAVNLLRIVNSVGYGLSRSISSLRHAITLLGRRQLQRWLQLLLMTPAGKTPDISRSPLLQVAALRGRMMEMLIERSHPRDKTLSDQAFITGIMSMMPQALGLPISEIVEQITLEPEIELALTLHDGILGKILALLEYFDAENIPGCETLLKQFQADDLDRNALNQCLLESLRWINGNDE